MENSQAKGPVSDDTLESSKGAAPKKQPGAYLQQRYEADQICFRQFDPGNLSG